MSGTSNMAWASRFNDHAENAKKQAELVNCTTASSQELIDCLRTIDGTTLTLAQAEMHEMFKHTRAKLMLSYFYPRVDPVSLHFLCAKSSRRYNTGSRSNKASCRMQSYICQLSKGLQPKPCQYGPGNTGELSHTAIKY